MCLHDEHQTCWLRALDERRGAPARMAVQIIGITGSRSQYFFFSLPPANIQAEALDRRIRSDRSVGLVSRKAQWIDGAEKDLRSIELLCLPHETTLWPHLILLSCATVLISG
jgi:hypothetical protein